MGVSIFREKSLIKDGMCGVEDGIFLCMMYKVVSIVLIPNKYHQFKVWCEFFGMNFNKEKCIGSTTKDTEVQYFRFIP